MPLSSPSIRTVLVLAAMSAAVVGMLSVAGGAADEAAGPDEPGPLLLTAAAFDRIADERERSVALFNEAAKVIMGPRCMNCHPATRRPTQGDDLHAHMPPIHAGEKGLGVAGLGCASCHRSGNTTLVGSRIASVPGAEHWLLAPASMAWQGLTTGEICRQLKDPARNGGRSPAEIHKHVSTDHLVAWAWHPGEGRRPAAGSQDVFGALIEAWVETGAQCPD